MGEPYRDLSVLFSKDHSGVNLNGFDRSSLTIRQNAEESVSRQIINCLKISLLILLVTLAVTVTIFLIHQIDNGKDIRAIHEQLMRDSKLKQEIPIRAGQLEAQIDMNLTSISPIQTTITVTPKLEEIQVMKVKDDDQVDKLKSTESCGGVILVPDKMDFQYVANKNENCVWIIWTRNLGTIGYKFQSIKGHNLTPLTLHLFKAESISNSSFEPSPKVIVAEDLNKDLEFGHSLGILMATAKKGQGFHLKIHCVGYCGSVSTVLVSVKSLTVTRGQYGSFAHPSDRSQDYENNERKLILLGPREGHRGQIYFEFVDVHESITGMTDDNKDYLSVFKFSWRFGAFILVQKYQGKLYRLRHANFVGEENEPILIFFYSDHKNPCKGFQFSYNYIPV